MAKSLKCVMSHLCRHTTIISVVLIEEFTKIWIQLHNPIPMKIVRLNSVVEMYESKP